MKKANARGHRRSGTSRVDFLEVVGSYLRGLGDDMAPGESLNHMDVVFRNGQVGLVHSVNQRSGNVSVYTPMLDGNAQVHLQHWPLVDIRTA